jgi:hypothetical protein
MIDDYSRHEALHMASVCASFVERHLYDLAYVQNRPELMKLIGDAIVNLASAYQVIGQEHFSEQPK